MRRVRFAALAIAALVVPVFAFATHVPGSSEVIVYDGSLTPSVAASGEIGWLAPLDGYDWYCFQAVNGTEISIRVTRTSGNIVPNVGIMNGLAEEGGTASLPILTASENDTESSVTLTFTPELDGPVTIWISTFLNEDGGGYTVTMTGGLAGSCGGEVAGPAGPSFAVQIPAELNIDPLFIGPSQTTSVVATTAIQPTFNSDLFLSVASTAREHEDFHVELSTDKIDAPGAGVADVTVTTGPLTFPRNYIVIVTATDTTGEKARNSFVVHVSCAPPFILGTHQPKSITAANGEQVTLEVTPSGTPPFFYQWFKGIPGMTRSPVLAANEAQLIFTTRETASYWVRISNACGTVNSSAATVTTVGTLSGPARRRSGG